MLNNIKVNWQSSIQICGEKTKIYIDPWKIAGKPHDADVILITHSHYDHMSEEDIERVAGKHTILVAPKSMQLDVSEKTECPCELMRLLSPGDEIVEKEVRIKAVPAYNINKEYHKRSFGWLGYLITVDDYTYYVAGDTDVNDDIKTIKCDIAMIPIGGHYTMDKVEAAQYINELKPKYCIPTHYGCIEGVGTKQTGADFAQMINNDIKVVIKL